MHSGWSNLRFASGIIFLSILTPVTGSSSTSTYFVAVPSFVRMRLQQSPQLQRKNFQARALLHWINSIGSMANLQEIAGVAHQGSLCFYRRAARVYKLSIAVSTSTVKNVRQCQLTSGTVSCAALQTLCWIHHRAAIKNAPNISHAELTANANAFKYPTDLKVVEEWKFRPQFTE